MIGESEWHELLESISSGDFNISSVCKNGIPMAIQGGSYIDMREMVRALVVGYMRNYNKLKSFRNISERWRCDNVHV